VGDGEALQKILRRHTGPGRKQAMKVELAQASLPGEHCQLRLLCMMLIQVPDHASDSFVIVHVVSLPLRARSFHPLLAANCNLYLQARC